MTETSWMRILGHCSVCGTGMVSSANQRSMIPSHLSKHGGHGLCSRHYARWLRHGDPTVKQVPRGGRRPKGTPRRSREEVLEDYAVIREDVGSIREAAERMGMTFAALDGALYRARKAGIPGAEPPLAQRMRNHMLDTYQEAS